MDQLTHGERDDRHAAARSRHGLDAIASPLLAPVFRRPTRLGVDSAWYGHIPFAQWIVAAIRPTMLVELGSHAGVSYAAFCDSVIAEGLTTACYAVDTWQGDEHAGFYGEDVFTSLERFHQERYAGFSRLLRCTFDEALPYLPEASVDLLHIDGRHGYEDVMHDFESWRGKLSSRAVVLFHDINVRERGFGVWRLWETLRGRHPSFAFLHAHGLGVLAVGPDMPPAIASLCALDDPASIAAIRERFALLGERWELARNPNESEIGLWAARVQAELDATRPKLAEWDHLRKSLRIQLAEAKNWAVIFETEASIARRQAEAAGAALDTERAAATDRRALEARLADLAERLAQAEEAARGDATAHTYIEALLDHNASLRARLGQGNEERRLLLASTSWRLTAPLRALLAWRGRTAPIAPAIEIPPPPPAPPPAPARPAGKSVPEAAMVDMVAPQIAAPIPEPAPPATRGRVLFLAGEPGTPGEIYRVARYRRVAERLGWEAASSAVGPVGPPELEGARIVVFWRVEYSPHVQGIMDFVRARGGTVVFDVDDLMVKPELATPEIIDAIRSLNYSEIGTREFFGRIRKTMDEADLCVTTTEELAAHMRELGKTTHILPNCFDDEALAASRRAMRFWRACAPEGEEQPDGRLRIGYAGGTRTHQRDFAQCVSAVARLLRERDEALLVLFRDPRSAEGVVIIDEFPELAGLEDRIEWRDMVDLRDLPRELARFSINLAPLETGNAFCEAKSELKWFEAALVEVPTIASPTGPFRRAIVPGESGLLADTEAEWHAALTRLAGDPALRRRIARNAYHDAIATFGPHRATAALATFLDQLDGGERGARAFAQTLYARSLPRWPAPVVPDADILFEHDKLGSAKVTVSIASYNYVHHVLEAMESVRTQTLEALDLVIADDVSSDESVDVILAWAKIHAARFNRLIVLRHRANGGLGASRNSGFAGAETPYVLPLDSDNRLRRDACETLLAALEGSRAAFAYPLIQQFGDARGIMGDVPFQAMRLSGGNYIDAMALVRKDCWAAAGGYYVRRDAMGWEDYDLWCRFIELGLWGEPVREVLADYRVHHGSMVNAITETSDNKTKMVAFVEARHPWLRILSRKARIRK